MSSVSKWWEVSCILCICLSTLLPVYVSVYLFIHVFACMSIYLAFHLLVCPCVYLFTYLLACLYPCLMVWLSVWPSACPSFYLFKEALEMCADQEFLLSFQSWPRVSLSLRRVFECPSLLPCREWELQGTQFVVSLRGKLELFPNWAACTSSRQHYPFSSPGHATLPSHKCWSLCILNGTLCSL